MRVCLVNTTDLVGGAERCSFDLHTGLRRRGHDCTLVVGRRLSDDPHTIPGHYPAWDWMPRAALHAYLGLTDTVLVTPLRLALRHPAFRTAEVVNIHNMHGDYWNFWTVPLLARHRPVVLTLHDEWLYTGDCVYAYDCARWKQSCGRCPQMKLKFRPDLGGRDCTRVNLALKRAALRRAHPGRVAVVSPSRWLAGRARESVLGRFPMHVIPNGIRVQDFEPRPQAEARERLNIPSGAVCFLMLANNLDDPRKGMPLLERMLNRHTLPAGARLLVAGNGAEAIAAKYPGLPLHSLGYLKGPSRLSDAYSAADALLLLSSADNLPYAGIEATTCACPIIALNAGGIGEIVEDGVNGWLLPAGLSAEGLAAALAGFSQLSSEQRRAMGRRGRERAMREFSEETFLDRYEKLFLEMAARA